MKKFNVALGLFVFFALWCGNYQMAEASDLFEEMIPVDKSDILYYSEDYEGVKEIEDEIESALLFLSGEKVELTEEDYKNVVKVYIDADVLRMDTDSQEEIEARLAEADYVWYLSRDDKYEVTICKEDPISDEDVCISDGESLPGKTNEWEISSYGEGSNTDYALAIISNEPDIGSYDRIVVLGGEVWHRQPIGVAFKDKTAKEVVVVEPMVDIAINETKIFDFKQAVINSKNVVVSDDLATGAAANMSEFTKSGSTANNYLLAGIAAAAAAAAGLCAFGIWKRRKKAS